MRNKTRSRLMTLTVFGIFIYFVVINIVNQTGLIGGNWVTINTNMMSNAPYIIGIALGFILLIKAVDTILNSILVCSFMGVFFSGLFYNLNTNGIWIDEIVSASFTITDLQFVIVLFWMMMGILIGLIKR